MAQPFNYMLNAQDPAQSVMGGVQNALSLANISSQRDLAVQKTADLKKTQDAQAQMQADLAGLSQNMTPSALTGMMAKYPSLSEDLKRTYEVFSASQKEDQARQTQAQMQADLGALASNPTPSALISMMAKYPSLGENFKRTYDVLSSEQKDARLTQATQVYAALQAGKPEIAAQLLVDQATAYRNSGQEREAQTLDDLSALVKASPGTASTSAGLFLASAMGPDKFAETFTKLQSDRREAELQPSKLTEAQAKAQKAAVDAKFAESGAVLDLQKKGWDVTKIQEDIKIAKQNASIAAINAQIAREGNQLKREELQLKLQDMVQKRDEAVRTKVSDLESARSQMDNMLNTADRVLNTPISVVGSAAGPVSSRMPTLSQDTADFEALVETLGSQSFMAQIPNIKGMGALSNAEGEKLQAALQNFSLKQSPERLLANVREAQRLILKARKNMTTRAGLPETIPDTPAVSTSGSDIDALVKKYTQGAR